MKKQVKNEIKRIAISELKKTPLARHPVATLGRAAARFGPELLAGLGDYTVKSRPKRTVIGRKSNKSTARSFTFQATSTGCVVHHREFVTDIVASTTAGAFSNTSYPINPGMYSTFPWLYPIAQQYDQWSPEGMIVEFVSSSSDYSGTANLGTVTYAADYDVVDPIYLNKIEMNNADLAKSGPCSSNFQMAIECNPSQRPNKLFYTRNSAITGENLRNYDLANLQVATYGCSAGQVVGELWITYKIRFLKPQAYSSLVGKNLLYYSAFSANPTSASPYGTTRTVSAASNMTPTFTLTDITFPNSLRGACFEVSVSYVGASTATAGFSITFSSSCTSIKRYAQSATTSGITQATTGTDTEMFIRFAVFLSGITSADMTATITGLTIPSSATAAVINIYQINPLDVFP